MYRISFGILHAHTHQDGFSEASSSGVPLKNKLCIGWYYIAVGMHGSYDQAIATLRML